MLGEVYRLRVIGRGGRNAGSKYLSLGQLARLVEEVEATPADVDAPTQNGSAGNGTKRGPKRAAILGAIREAPGIGLGELALRIYDEDTPTNRKRVQSLVSVLKRLGEVRTAGRGRFEVV